MLVVFSNSTFPETVSTSIVLAGPSPRNWNPENHGSRWRHDALDILLKLGYRGVVYIPIPRDKFYSPDDKIGAYTIYDPAKQQPFAQHETKEWNYDSQVEWEFAARARADVEVFWVDRRMPETPGLTTNIEFGQSLPIGKVVYGRPDDADNVRYLDQCFVGALNPNKIHPLPLTNLEDTLQTAVKYLYGFADPELNGANLVRNGFETKIPLFLWVHPPFQKWLRSQNAAGNRVEEVNIKQAFFIAGKLFASVLHVSVWVDREQRYKSNEHIATRYDMSAVVPFVNVDGEWSVLMVSEFRSPVRNTDNMVIEVPSGSSFNPKKNPLQIALAEVKEETGISVAEQELVKVGEFQPASTQSVHTVSVYGCELDYDRVAEHIGVTTGNVNETEQTTTRLVKLQDIMAGAVPGIDLSMTCIIVRAAVKMDII